MTIPWLNLLIFLVGPLLLELNLSHITTDLGFYPIIAPSQQIADVCKQGDGKKVHMNNTNQQPRCRNVCDSY